MVGRTFEFSCNGLTWGVTFDNATRMRHHAPVDGRWHGPSAPWPLADVSGTVGNHSLAVPAREPSEVRGESAYLATPVDDSRIFVYRLEHRTPSDQHAQKQCLALRYILNFSDMTFIGHNHIEGRTIETPGVFKAASPHAVGRPTTLSSLTR